MVQPTIRQLEYFVAAVEEGSVTAAAARCNASQASVSSALAELERGLGLLLLTRRSAKGVTPTPSGARLVAIARRILDDVGELTATAEVETDEIAGPLRVACTIALSPRILPPLARAFATRHPRVELDLVDGLASEVQRLVRTSAADACLLYRRQVEPGLRVRPLRRLPPYAVLAADHPLAARDAVSLHELADERLILVERTGSLGVIEALIAEAGVDARHAWSFANPETVRSMVANGLGYSVFSGRSIGTETFDGRAVRYVAIADDVAPNEVVVATSSDRIRTARIAALESELADPAMLAAYG